MTADDSLPNDIEILKRLVRTREAELSQASAEASSAEALIAHLRLTIEKLKRDLFGPRNERKARLIDEPHRKAQPAGEVADQHGMLDAALDAVAAADVDVVVHANRGAR